MITTDDVLAEMATIRARRAAGECLICGDRLDNRGGEVHPECWLDPEDIPADPWPGATETFSI